MAFNKDKCLKFEALETCTITLGPSLVDKSHYQFSKDGIDWVNDTITLNSGETCYVKGTNQPGKTTDFRNFVISNPAKIVSGNLMSLIDDGAGDSIVAGPGCFNSLFENCSQLKSIPSGLLPATTLAEYCYSTMFMGCTGLTSIPEGLLPAMTLANNCYQNLFNKCTGLTSIPADLLPATTLANYCYQNMFYGCTGLTSIPADLLPATNLANYCYRKLFYQCTGLTSIPSGLLPATNLAESCYVELFCNCTGLTSIPADLLPATTLANYCYQNMFANCSGLTSAPDGLLPAKNLVNSCYSKMFFGCPLEEIYVSFKEWNPSNATESWLNGAAAEGKFYCPRELPQVFGANRIPKDWEVKTPVKKEPEFNTMTFQGNLTAPWNKWKTI